MDGEVVTIDASEQLPVAKAEMRILRAAWALQNASLLRSLGADLSWCRDWCRSDPFARTTSSSSKVIPPVDVKVPLRNYQLEGVAFLTSARDKGLSVVLGDEMGLGKTLETITYLAHLKCEREMPGPHLILCPVSVLQHWIDEFRRCAPSLRVVDLSGTSNKHFRPVMLGYPNNYDVLVSTYSVAASLLVRAFFMDTWWQTLVLDEGHIIKNEKTRQATVLRKIQHVQTVILTSTPLQCNLHESWALLSYLLPDLFPDSRLFDSVLQLGRQQPGVRCSYGSTVPTKAARCLQPSRRATTGASQEKGATFRETEQQQSDVVLLQRVHDLLQMCMLRRTEETVEQAIPEKADIQFQCATAVQSQSCRTLTGAELDAERDRGRSIDQSVEGVVQRGQSYEAASFCALADAEKDWAQHRHEIVEQVCMDPTMNNERPQTSRHLVAYKRPRWNSKLQKRPAAAQL